MYQKIMVPLDGSKAAEEVFPQLRKMIECGRAGLVILARAVPFTPEVVIDYVLPADLVASLDQSNRRDAQHYLDDIERQIDWRGIPHRTEVLIGSPEIALPRFAEKEGVELVLMAEPARKGLFHGLRRCLADKVLHASSVPVELYSPSVFVR